MPPQSLDHKLDFLAVKSLAEAGYPISKIASELKVSYSALRSYVKRNNIHISFSQRKYTDEQLIQAVTTSISIADVMRKLNLSVTAGNYQTISKKIVNLGVDTSHFRGKSHGTSFTRKIPTEEMFTENSTVDRGLVKRRIIKDNLLENRCAICSSPPTWLGSPLVLVLDHINGVNNDHRLENLRFLCPNCNSQTSTFCGRNSS